MPQDREGTFSTQLFDRYQRNEKALVLAVLIVKGVREGGYREILAVTLADTECEATVHAQDDEEEVGMAA